MKERLIIFIVLFCLLILTGCSKSSTEVEDEPTSYYLTITNNSSYDITELVVSMVGSDDIQEISILHFGGDTTQNFEFRLPPPSDDNPISFGDYNISYLQNGIEKCFGITLPETHISVLIDDDGFTVDDMTFFITIKNMSSFHVSNIEISMEGALESYQIDELDISENSSEFEFYLINSGPVPSSFGCYIGSYLQNDITKSFLFSPCGYNNILMEIFDDGYGHSIEG